MFVVLWRLRCFAVCCFNCSGVVVFAVALRLGCWFIVDFWFCDLLFLVWFSAVRLPGGFGFVVLV